MEYKCVKKNLFERVCLKEEKGYKKCLFTQKMHFLKGNKMMTFVKRSITDFLPDVLLNLNDNRRYKKFYLGRSKSISKIFLGALKTTVESHEAKKK